MPLPSDMMSIMEEVLHQPTRVLGLSSKSSDVGGGVDVPLTASSASRRGAGALSLKSHSGDPSAAPAHDARSRKIAAVTAAAAAAAASAKRTLPDVAPGIAAGRGGDDSQGSAKMPPANAKAQAQAQANGADAGAHVPSGTNTSSKAGGSAAPSSLRRDESRQALSDFPGLRNDAAEAMDSNNNHNNNNVSHSNVKLMPLPHQHRNSTESSLKYRPHASAKSSRGGVSLSLKAASYDQYQTPARSSTGAAKVVPLTADALKGLQEEMQPLTVAQKLQKPAAPSAVKSIFDDPVGAARAKAVGRAMQQAESSKGSSSSSRLLSMDPAKMGFTHGVKPTRRRSII